MFDYPYTCPAINKEIKKAKAILEELIKSIITRFSPMIPEGHADLLAHQEAENAYHDFEDIFEKTRAINEDMRSEADTQIYRKNKEIRELENEVESLQLQIKELEENLNSVEKEAT